MTSYHKSEAKQQARKQTIIDMYRQVYKQKSVPLPKQYWCLCAQCIDENGNTLEGSEFHQLTTSKFIKDYQFYGVDKDTDIIKTNSKYRNAHWYNGDMINVLMEASTQKDFNPAIINFDSVNGPKLASAYTSDILEIVKDKKDIMIVSNVITKNRGRIYDKDLFFEYLYKQKSYQKALSLGWKAYNYRYSYTGSTNKSVMTSYILYKQN